MATENYVSFEIAKLLNEKGFDWCESPFYSEQDRDEWRQNNSYTIPNMLYDPDLPFDSETLTMVAPHVSIQMAMKWLREVHKIEVRVIYDNDKSSWYGACNPMRESSQILLGFGHKSKSYEEACEVAIKYCLEKLV